MDVSCGLKTLYVHELAIGKKRSLNGLENELQAIAGPQGKQNSWRMTVCWRDRE
jgi:hypothetical protein